MRGLKRMATPRLRAAGSKANTDLNPCCSRMSPTSSWSCVHPPSGDRNTATGRPRRNSCTSTSGAKAAAAPDPDFPSEEGAVAVDSSWMSSSLTSAATAADGAAVLSAADSIGLFNRVQGNGIWSCGRLVLERPRWLSKVLTGLGLNLAKAW